MLPLWGWYDCRMDLAPASGLPGLSQSWRLPGCFGPQGPNSHDVDFEPGLVLAGLALAEAIAVAVHFKDVHVVGQPVEACAGQAF